MFVLSVILSLSGLCLLDLLILVLASRGVGIVIIIVTQLAGALWGGRKIWIMDFNLFFYLDAELKKGEPIVRELWEEATVLTGACLLVVPGFLSDLVGIFFLIPPLRTLVLDIIHES
jgi:UPF0716 protein FxsA